MAVTPRPGGGSDAISQTPHFRVKARLKPNGTRGFLMRQKLAIVLFAAALALPAGHAFAQAPEPEQRLMSMSGVGTVQASPDMANITLGVVSENESAREALSANSRSMARVLDTLKEEGLEPRDLQTSGFSLEPVFSQPPPGYDHSRPFRPEIVAYRVHNNVTVRVRELDRVGAILDLVVTLGANSVSGPVFKVEDSKPLEDKARVAAVRDARRKAELYAGAADVTLGPIMRIDESYSRPPQPFQAAPMMRMEAADGSVPIESGELTFEAQVTVSWELRD